MLLAITILCFCTLILFKEIKLFKSDYNLRGGIGDILLIIVSELMLGGNGRCPLNYKPRTMITR